MGMDGWRGNLCYATPSVIHAARVKSKVRQSNNQQNSGAQLSR